MQLDCVPAGEKVTVPDPVPAFVYLIAKVGAVLNVAVTAFAADIVNWHVLVPEHAPPDQPVNVEPEGAVAVNVTTVPDV